MAILDQLSCCQPFLMSAITKRITKMSTVTQPLKTVPQEVNTVTLQMNLRNPFNTGVEALQARNLPWF